MNSRKPQIVLLLAALVLVGAMAMFMRGPGSGGATIRMAGQVGLVAELLDGTARYLAGGQDKRLAVTGGHKMDFLQNSDCCAANTTWGLGVRSLQGAVMCPDAAREFLAENGDFVSLGPIMFNSDVFMLNGAIGTVRKVGVSHKRSHQILMAEAVFELQPSGIVPMLPVGLPYALKKGEVDAIIIDLGVAAEIESSYTGWAGRALPTQVLVLHKEFAESEAFADFALAYARARKDIIEKYAGSGLVMPELGLAE